MLDLIVKGGLIVTGSGVCEGDIGIDEGKIVAILSKDMKLESSQAIDATNKIIMPGFIDVHVHDRAQVAGLKMIDTPEDISHCAAYGGITSFVFYIGARWGEKPVDEYFSSIIEEEERLSVVDFGIHCMLFPDKAHIKGIPDVAKMGIKSFKMVLGYHPSRGWVLDDSLLMLALENIASVGGLAMFHCENGYVIGYLEDKFVDEGRYSAETFLEARPNLAEAETIYRTICLAQMTGCPIYIVHLSTEEGLELIAKARAEGKNVTAETCPQYLLLNDKHVRRQGALLKMAPPIRLAKDNDALWNGICTGNIDVVGSDHASYSKTKKLEVPDFRSVPFGIPGTETMVPLIYSEGVVKSRITLHQMAKVLSENPARLFGLYPRKGTIRVGSDADLVIIDPATEWEIKIDDLHYKTGFTPYEGWRAKGKPVLSLLRGQILLKDGELQKHSGFGIYCKMGDVS